MAIRIILTQLLLANLCFAQFTPEWVKFYNTYDNSQDFGYSLVIDKENNVVVSGTSQTLISGEDFITIKYSPSGSEIWAKRYNDSAFSMETCNINAVDEQNNIYAGGIAAISNGWNYTIVKYSPSGNIKWINKILIPTNQVGYLYSVITDNSLNVYYCATTPGLGTELVKIDSNGTTQWRRTFQGSNYGLAVCVVDKISGSVVVCNSVPDTINDLKTTKYSGNGDTLWNRYYNNISPVDLCIVNGDIYITASTQNSSITTLKYTSGGSLSWSKVYERYSTNSAKSIIPSGSGYLYIGGNVSGLYSDFIILKYSLFGDLIWDRTFDSNIGEDGLHDICLDSNENIYASGISNNGCSTVKFNKEGNYINSHIYRIQPNETSWGFSNGYSNNALYVTGYGIGNGTGCDIITLKYSTLIGISPVSEEIPHQFSLEQNFPNPFNPSTKIRFDISGTSSALTFLSVYDILGREVSTLVNEELKPGTYEVDWNAEGGAADCPSGVYFYKLTSGKFSETKKMILMK